MERRRIGGLEVSLAGMGCNNFGRRIDEAATRQVVLAALDAGITFFDTAESYGDGASEEYLGRALAGRRDQASIATKFAWRAPGRDEDVPGYVSRSVEASLRRLETDRIDLYYYHHPHPEVQVAEVLEGMNRLVDQGKVLDIGCSNFSPGELEEAAVAARERGLRPFVVVQNEYNLLERAPEHGVLDACERLGMMFVPYYPLASGLLTGKYRRGRTVPGPSRLGGGDGANAEDVVDATKLGVVERLATYAESRGHSLLELALAWLPARPRVASVIAGARSPEQVRANATAIEAWHLSDRELTEIDELLQAA